MKHFKLLGTLLLAVGILMTTTNGCKKDTNNNNNNNNTGGTTENYILFNGVKVTFVNPKIGVTKIIAGDTAYQWSGNLPGGFGDDTTLTIIHIGKRIAGSPTKLDPQGITEGEVAIDLRWSIIAGQPWPGIVGGDYKLERVNGKWVSTLKNGVGEWTNSGGTKQTYTGIEFRVEWPN
ncbi:MAG: hypothetical protein KG003_07570 [Bacteroidetes bacterium]|nr:hypothetical protein [Bacteroidota bacterium]